MHQAEEVVLDVLMVHTLLLEIMRIVLNDVVPVNSNIFVSVMSGLFMVNTCKNQLMCELGSSRSFSVTSLNYHLGEENAKKLKNCLRYI